MYIHTSVLLCRYMHRESESDVKVDPIVKWIWSKVWITTLITISITNLITRLDLGSTIQGWPLSKGGSGFHYPRVATIQGWPLSKGGSGVHYPRVATIPAQRLSSMGGPGPRERSGRKADFDSFKKSNFKRGFLAISIDRYVVPVTWNMPPMRWSRPRGSRPKRGRICFFLKCFFIFVI